jgi:hypothetical protein
MEHITAFFRFQSGRTRLLGATVSTVLAHFHGISITAVLTGPLNFASEGNTRTAFTETQLLLVSKRWRCSAAHLRSRTYNGV